MVDDYTEDLKAIKLGAGACLGHYGICNTHHVFGKN